MKISIRTPADIGALIRDRRTAMSISQAELATQIGTSRLWVNEIESGKPGASLGKVLRALSAVGAELSFILPEAKKPAAALKSPDLGAIIESEQQKRRR